MPTTVNRRQFGSLSVATVLASLLRVRPEHDLHWTITQFCNPESGRSFDLTSPFVVSRMAYATDGRAMARITTLASDTDAIARRVPNFSLVMGQAVAAGTYVAPAPTGGSQRGRRGLPPLP